MNLVRRRSSRSPSRLVTAAWGLFVFALASPSQADEPFGTRTRGWTLMPGVNGGARWLDGASVLAGGEVSVVHLDRDLFWKGAYVDANYDFGFEQLRLSAGPEIGYEFLGLDAGYLIAKDADALRHGFVARGIFTAGILALHCRYGVLLGDAPSSFLETAISLKIPVKL